MDRGAKMDLGDYTVISNSNGGEYYDSVMGITERSPLCLKPHSVTPVVQ